MPAFPLRKFLKKLFFASIPAIIAVLIYVYNDPFKVLFHYNTFETHDVRINYLNRDYTTTEIFLNNYDKHSYDSYIFGSSRAGVYMIKDWKQHINSKACFQYSSYYEGLYGVERKLAFLDSKGVVIKNALLIVDHELLSEIVNPDEPLSRKHPLITGESNLSFQFFMFKSFLQLDYLTSKLRIYLEDQKVKKAVVKDTAEVKIQVEKAANEEPRWYATEREIEANPDLYYEAKKAIFHSRKATTDTSEAILKEKHIALLTNIKDILQRHGTSYKIVISPLYDQKKLNPQDLGILSNIFGAGNVTDFSGRNEITNNVRNYYEYSHYRIAVAQKIMDSIYRR